MIKNPSDMGEKIYGESSETLENTISNLERAIIKEKNIGNNNFFIVNLIFKVQLSHQNLNLLEY